MVRRLRIAILTVLLIVALAVFFVWAPMVPYEREVLVEAPSTGNLCPGAQICQTSTFHMWARSYASFGYDLFGYGTPPFGSPVTVEKDGIVTAFNFNGTSGFQALDQVPYPASSPEPIPILRINGLTLYPNGAPFGGNVWQISITNLGIGETLEVSWGNGITGTQELPAGATALFNSTDWTGARLPAEHTLYAITLTITIHYPKYWLSGFDTQTVEVNYAT